MSKIHLEMIDFSGINIELRDTFREWDAMMRERIRYKISIGGFNVQD